MEAEVRRMMLTIAVLLSVALTAQAHHSTTASNSSYG